jgi:hypothetical protein
MMIFFCFGRIDINREMVARQNEEMIIFTAGPIWVYIFAQKQAQRFNRSFFII